MGGSEKSKFMICGEMFVVRGHEPHKPVSSKTVSPKLKKYGSPFFTRAGSIVSASTIYRCLPHIAVYRVRLERVEILRVYHAAQDRTI